MFLRETEGFLDFLEGLWATPWGGPTGGGGWRGGERSEVAGLGGGGHGRWGYGDKEGKEWKVNKLLKLKPSLYTCTKGYFRNFNKDTCLHNSRLRNDKA